jgi:hypothetical protein
MVSALAPCAEAGIAFNVASEVLIEDISAEMLIASAASNTGAVIITTNGMTNITATGVTGDQFTMSFTAGTVVVKYMGTFTSSGGQPGTGTWTINTQAGSDITSSGMATVTYDSGTSTFTIALDYQFPDTNIPGVGKVNDFHVVSEVHAPLGPSWESVDTGYFTLDGNRRGGLYDTVDGLGIRGIILGQWTQDVSGSGSIQGNVGTGTGTFSGSVSAIPEPSSIVLLSISAAISLAYLRSSKKA